MIDKDFLESLIRMVDESSLDNLEIERGGTRIRLGKSPDVSAVVSTSSGTAPPPSAPTSEPASEPEAAAAPASNLIDVTSPMVGTFYRAPSPDADAYADVGSQIGVGDVLCIIEAMKLMNELESETAGRVAEVCVENGEPVEYGQPLFKVRLD